VTDLKDDYGAAVKRLYDRHDVMAEGPGRPGDLRVRTQSIAAKIATLAQKATEAADLLEEARVRHHTASGHRSKCEAAFAEAAAGLIQALNEHREGTPENVPYQP
jgi:hypothetical protein